MKKEVAAWQIKLIKTLQGKHGIDEESYRDILAGFKVTSCKDLSFGQAELLISRLKGGSETTKSTSDRASPGQIQLFRFYALPCAIEYAAIGEYVEERTGEVIAGDALRAWLRQRFEEGANRQIRKQRPSIPPNILTALYEWINPAANRFLREGGFRRYVKDEKKLYYQQLTYNEITCIINRFREMYTILEQRESAYIPDHNQ